MSSFTLCVYVFFFKKDVCVKPRDKNISGCALVHFHLLKPELHIQSHAAT